MVHVQDIVNGELGSNAFFAPKMPRALDHGRTLRHMQTEQKRLLAQSFHDIIVVPQ